MPDPPDYPAVVDMGAYEYQGLPGDTDGGVDVFDVIAVVDAFGTTPSDPDWDPRCDFNGNDVVDVFDVITVVNNFGTGG